MPICFCFNPCGHVCVRESPPRLEKGILAKRHDLAVIPLLASASPEAAREAGSFEHQRVKEQIGKTQLSEEASHGILFKVWVLFPPFSR